MIDKDQLGRQMRIFKSQKYADFLKKFCINFPYVIKIYSVYDLCEKNRLKINKYLSNMKLNPSEDLGQGEEYKTRNLDLFSVFSLHNFHFCDIM